MKNGVDSAFCRRVVEMAMHTGADQAEAYASAGRELNIEVRDQEIETLKMAGDRGLGLRVLKEGKMGFAYTSDLSQPALEELAKRALANAVLTAVDQYNDLPGPTAYAKWQPPERDIEETTLEQKIELVKEMERQARAFDPRVRITDGCSYEDAAFTVTLANSRGVDAACHGSYCGAYASVVAVEGEDQQTGFELMYSLKFKDLDPGRLGRSAGQKAVRMLGAVNLPTRRLPLVLDPFVATSFLGVLGPALSAEAVQKHRSLLAGRLGQEVASSLVEIVDDGAMEGGLLSAPFDGEGVPTSRRVLIKGGVLREFLYNTYTAAKDGVKSTGNATRSSFKGTPEVGTTNFYLARGTTPRQELLAGVQEGLYLTEVLGMHTANPISGDFSVGVSGLLLKNGEFAGAVRGMAIAGNILELFNSVEAVGDDLTFFVGRGSPTLLLGGLTVSGR